MLLLTKGKPTKSWCIPCARLYRGKCAGCAARKRGAIAQKDEFLSLIMEAQRIAEARLKA